MLTYLTLLLVCYGTQPCEPDVTFGPRVTHSSLANHQLRPELQKRESSPSLRLSSGRQTLLAQRVSAATASPIRLSRPPGRNVSKAMLICAGVVAGFYAGGTIGAAVDDHPDKGLGLLGMPIGGAIGGLVVWKLVR